MKNNNKNKITNLIFLSLVTVMSFDKLKGSGYVTPGHGAAPVSYNPNLPMSPNNYLPDGNMVNPGEMFYGKRAAYRDSYGNPVSQWVVEQNTLVPYIAPTPYVTPGNPSACPAGQMRQENAEGLSVCVNNPCAGSSTAFPIIGCSCNPNDQNWKLDGNAPPGYYCDFNNKIGYNSNL